MKNARRFENSIDLIKKLSEKRLKPNQLRYLPAKNDIINTLNSKS